MNSQTGKTIPRALSARVLAVLLAAVFMIPLCLPVSHAATNPYPYWQTNSNGDRVRPCTWYCWQQAYDRLGIELYGYLGNGGQWLNNAVIQGYPTGNEAQPDSIAVYSGGKWGHVAYVTAVNGGTMTVIEGGRGLRYYPNAGINSTGESAPSTVGSVRWGTHTLLGFIYLRPQTPTWQPVSVAEGMYYVINGGSYLSLDGAASYDPGSYNNHNVSVSSGPSEEVKWQLSAVADGYIFSPIVSTDGRVLNAYADAPANGTNVNIQDSHVSRSDRCQWWKFEAVSGGYIIHNVKNQNVVLAVSGGNVCVQTRTGDANQIWSLRSTQKGCDTHSWDNGTVTKEASYTEDGSIRYTCTVCGETRDEVIPMLTYQYVNVAEGDCLVENQGGFQYSYLIADGAESYDPASFQNRNVSVWTGPDACEVWRISAAADGYMLSPVVATDGRVLNAYANEPVSGTNVNIQDNHYPAREDTCQWWKFEHVSGGYLIHNVHNPHVVLAVSGDGHNVIVESRTGAANQIWVLRSYSSDPTPTPTPEPTATPEPTPEPTQTPDPTEAPARIPGDVDENGSVNLTDALLVLQYELHNDPNPTINLANANVNGDECVDMLDVSLIAQYAAGWDVTLK